MSDIPRSSAQRLFDFGSIKGSHNSLRLSKKLRIVIGMPTSEFML
jgi:hypothetical protein